MPSAVPDAGGTAEQQANLDLPTGSAQRRMLQSIALGGGSSAVLGEAWSSGIGLSSSAFSLEMVSLLEKLPFGNCLQS